MGIQNIPSISRLFFVCYGILVWHLHVCLSVPFVHIVKWLKVHILIQDQNTYMVDDSHKV